MKKIYFALLFVLLFAAAAFAALDLNSATKEQLDALPGIGPKKAEAIVQYRTEKGPFKNVEQLKEVSGIGEKIFQGIKNEVTVGAAAPAEKPAETVAVKPEAKAPAKPEEKKQPEAAAKEPEKTAPPAATKK
ncbi:ComEA family DNA-binding protein [Candidatus Electronema sp. JM]|uniref:ComEA family DNA-binding protein n=1 Tax=Candidatus Electronema sp. JM TaxID=3401571 RepID=UPI003AA8F1B3